MTRKTICIDFDGVIHSYTSKWTKAEDIPDPPVPGAFAFLRAATERFGVVIQSTRAATDRWMVEHNLDQATMHRLSIMCTKPPASIYLDDRGWRFEGTFPDLDEIDAFQPWNRRSAP